MKPRMPECTFGENGGSLKGSAMIVGMVRSSEEGMGSSGAVRLVAQSHSGSLGEVLAPTIPSPVPTEYTKDLAARSRRAMVDVDICAVTPSW